MATEVKRGAGVTMFVALVLATGALGYGVASAAHSLGSATGAPAAVDSPTSSPNAPGTPGTPVTPGTPAASPSNQPAPQPQPQVVEPAGAPLTPVPAVLSPGDRGPKVRALQARLRQLAWYAGRVTDDYDTKTAEAVRGFQEKRGLPMLGYVDAATMKRLRAMTHRPTADELANKVSDGTWTDAPLDPRCSTGRALCVDKTSRTIRWVVDGTVRTTMAVRFGSSYTPTREGLFHVQRKSRHHVSSLYGSSMPFAMFFSGGQAVHYSSDFAAVGYSGASHGCVNVKDYDGLRKLFDRVEVGDKVVIYWS